MTPARKAGLQLLAERGERGAKRSTYTHGVRIFWQTCDWLVKQGLAEEIPSPMGNPTGRFKLTAEGKRRAEELA